jgi:uncharacterized protein (TIGR03118 family)
MYRDIHNWQQALGQSGRKWRIRARRPAVEVLEERALQSAGLHHSGRAHHDIVDAKKAKVKIGYTQTNLVSDLSTAGALVTDSNLKNPWGVAFSATSPFWISDQRTGVATIYAVSASGAVTKQALTVTIPTTATGSSSSPTGQVFNTTGSGFQIPGPNGTTVPAVFIFDTLQGTIAVWNPGSSGGMSTAEIMVNQGSSTEFTGLALGSSGGQNYLYAVNTTTSPGINVYNSSFKSVTLAGNFVDPKLSKGFSKNFTPYNIVNIGGELYVTYRGRNFRGGAVAEFNTDGTFVRQLASNGPAGKLQSPWGMTVAPSGFGKFSNDTLVGNFSNGKINAYSLKGKFLAQLTTNGRKPIVIPGLWSLAFGNGQKAGATDVLFFTAGINGQSDGLFGSLQPINPTA